MKQCENIDNLSRSEILENTVNMIIRNHLSYNQAESLFAEALKILKGIPYQMSSAKGDQPEISKEK